MSIGNEKRGPNGYLTVEAALILPIVLSVILSVIYLWFFQVDRLLLEADVTQACIRGAGERGLSVQDRVDLAGAMAGSYGKERYLAWSGNRVTAAAEHGQLTVTGEGSLAFPFPGLRLFGGDGSLRAAVTRSRPVRSEAYVLRMGRRVTGTAGSLLNQE